MKQFRMTLIFMVILAIIGYIIGVAISYFTTAGQDFVAALKAVTSIIIAIVGAVVGFIMGVTSKKKDQHNNKGTTSTGETFEINHDSKFLTEYELKTDKDLIFSSWRNLPSLKKTGFPFYIKDNHGDLNICMQKEKHALVLGTTGTGKTQIIVSPTIRILAHSAQKPSMIISDPKGELYRDHANVLKDEGYRIMVLDLEDPFTSSRWNPMENAFDLYQRATNLEKEVKKFTDVSPKEVGYSTFAPDEIDGVEYGNVWYGFEGKAFPNNEILRKELIAKKSQLEVQAKSELRNVAIAIAPVDEGAKDPSWSRGCQDFVLGIMEAMLEDSRDPRLGMTREKFNFFNVTKIANIRDNTMSDRESALKTLSAYSEGRDPINSTVHQLMQTICGTSSVTQRSFLGQLGTMLGTLTDEGILYMTSATDLNFKEIAKQPTAFFLRIPDHKVERHHLAVLCISQLYRTLVDVANTYPKQTLPRPVYFILDEFGNMPKVQGFGTMVTVARSRSIFFEIILQSYKQLDIKFGADEASNLRGNFQVQIFLGSEDESTIQAFSKACGETTVFHDEKSTSRSDKGDTGTNTTTSTQRTRRPLIEESELRTLKQGTIIAKIFGKDIIKDQMAFFWKTKCMVKNPAGRKIGISKKLDAEALYYDVEKRNKLVLKPRSPYDRF